MFGGKTRHVCLVVLEHVFFFCVHAQMQLTVPFDLKHWNFQITTQIVELILLNASKKYRIFRCIPLFLPTKLAEKSTCYC